MKGIICLSLIFVFSLTSHAQSWQENIKDPANFYSIRQAYLDYKAKSGEENSIIYIFHTLN
jgi:hypothetical protein